jgi:hypothetical protein
MQTSISLTTRVPCTTGYFGDKLVTYQTQVKPTELIALMGHDPRSKFWSRLPDDLRELYQYLQRKTNRERKVGTRRYIETRFAPGSRSLGAFPAIALGTLSHAKFEPYRDRIQGFASAGIGDLMFDLSAAHTRVLLDGLARVTGALDLIDDGQMEVVGNFTFPVTIYSPSERQGQVTVQELGQLFHDFNFLAAPIPTGQAVDLDQTNIYIQLTAQLGKTSVISDNGGMEPRAKSLGKKSTALVAKQVLLRFVKGATEGEDFLHTLRDMPDAPSKAKLTDDTFDHLAQRIERFLTLLANKMGRARFAGDRTSVHLSAPGWNALGVIFHDLEFSLMGALSDGEYEAIIDSIAGIDWSRYNKAWFDSSAADFVNFGAPDVASDGRAMLGKAHGGQQAITKLIQFVRAKSGIASRLPSAVTTPEAA